MQGTQFHCLVLCAVLMIGSQLADCAKLHAQGRMIGAPLRKQLVVTDVDPFLPKSKRSQPLQLAIHGYCPVTLRDHQQWVLGSREIQAIRDGHVYLFASARAREIFVAAPELYLPMLDGDCPVTFAESKKRQAGELEWGIIHQRRIIFFASQEKLHTFAADPQSYTDVDLVDGGSCVVSKVEEHRTVAGLPETVAIVDGLRYFFASAFHRRIFLLSPQRYGVSAAANSSNFAKIEIPDVEFATDVRSLTFRNQNIQLDGPPAGLAERKKGTTKNQRKAEEEESEERIENRALAGYCPVTIHTLGLWQRGKSKFKSTCDGKVYFMVGPEELAAFKENQREYVPVLGGDSIVAYVNDYDRVPGSVFHAGQYKNRLYLFANAKERKAFGENTALYEKADLAYRGNCTVTLVEEKREVPGLPEFESLDHGKRYRFVSQKYLDKFLADPKAFAEE
jgi:YHS domain-containing protein